MFHFSLGLVSRSAFKSKDKKPQTTSTRVTKKHFLDDIYIYIPRGLRSPHVYAMWFASYKFTSPERQVLPMLFSISSTVGSGFLRV